MAKEWTKEDSRKFSLRNDKRRDRLRKAIEDCENYDAGFTLHEGANLASRILSITCRVGMNPRKLP